jgi:hypothetical protein
MLINDGISNWSIIGSNGIVNTQGMAFIDNLTPGDVHDGTNNPVPQFRDNASAVTGGLFPGCLYRNGDILQIVH